jgi:hypothetical protein
VLTEGSRLTSLLRQALKEHYGIRSEKLDEFGLQPFRGRKAKPAPETPQPAPPPAVTPSGSAAKPPAPTSHVSTTPETV